MSSVEAATSEHELQDGGRTAWIKVFRPLGCRADVHVDGAFVVVPFLYSEKTSGGKTGYLPELLAEMFVETGLVFVAVCFGGAALCIPGVRAARFLVSVVRGNDVYTNRSSENVRFAVDGFRGDARDRFLAHFAVVGMSLAVC